MSTNPPVTDRFRAGTAVDHFERDPAPGAARGHRGHRGAGRRARLDSDRADLRRRPDRHHRRRHHVGDRDRVAGAALLAGAAGWALLATLEHLTLIRRAGLDRRRRRRAGGLTGRPARRRQRDRHREPASFCTSSSARSWCSACAGPPGAGETGTDRPSTGTVRKKTERKGPRHDRHCLPPGHAPTAPRHRGGCAGGGRGKRYGDTVALDGVDLAVPAGAITGLLGPNGAGKSTLLNLIVGLRRPDTGRVELFGGPPADAAAAAASASPRRRPGCRRPCGSVR